MKRDIKYSSQEDNWWVLKSWDFNGNGVVKIFCVECHKDIGGTARSMTKTNIQNLFNDFKAKHLQTTNQVKNDVTYTDHPQWLHLRITLFM